MTSFSEHVNFISAGDNFTLELISVRSYYRALQIFFSFFKNLYERMIKWLREF